MAELTLMVGLPGSGKTTRARGLAEECRALRLTPDEWMIPLFGDNYADGKRNVLEGRMLATALDALGRGIPVVLDYGCWSRDERSAIRWLAERVGGTYRLVYMPVDRATQLARVHHRQQTAAHSTFPMSEQDLDTWREQFQEPGEDELTARSLPDPPSEFPDWAAWAAWRWPSFPRDLRV